MMKYPLQSWLMSSYSAFLAGIVGMFMSIFFASRVDLSIFFLAAEISLQLTLRIWMKIFLKEPQ